MVYDFTGMTLEEACHELNVPKTSIEGFVNALFDEHEQYVIDNRTWLESMGANPNELVRRLGEQRAYGWYVGNNVKETVEWLLEYGMSPENVIERLTKGMEDLEDWLGVRFTKISFEHKNELEDELVDRVVETLTSTPALTEVLKNNEELFGDLLCVMNAWDFLSYGHLAKFSTIVKGDDLLSLMRQWADADMVFYVPWFIEDAGIDPHDYFTDLVCDIVYYDSDCCDESEILLKYLEIQKQYNLSINWDSFAGAFIDDSSYAWLIIDNFDALTENGFEFKHYATRVAISMIEAGDSNIMLRQDDSEGGVSWFIEHGADPTAIATCLVEHGKAEEVVRKLWMFKQSPKFKRTDFVVCLIKNRCAETLVKNLSYLANSKDEKIALVKCLVAECDAADMLIKNAEEIMRDISANDFVACFIDAHAASYIAKNLDRFFPQGVAVDYVALTKKLIAACEYDALESMIDYLVINCKDPTGLAETLVEAKLFSYLNSYYFELVEAGVDEDWLAEQLMLAELA